MPHPSKTTHKKAKQGSFPDAGGGGESAESAERRAETLVSRAMKLAGEKGQQNAALQAFEEALSLDPLRDDAAVGIAVLLDRMKGKKASETAILRKLKLSGPEAPRFQKILADRMLMEDRAQEAVVQYQFVLSFKPDYPEALAGLGSALQHLRRYDEAGICFEKALKIKPSADILGRIGSLLATAGHPDKALVYFRRALEIDPDSTILLTNHAAASFWAGLFADAFRGFHRLMMKTPDDLYPKMMLASVARNVHVEKFSSAMKALVFDCLKAESIEHQSFMALWLETLYCDPEFAPLIALVSCTTWEEFKAQFDPDRYCGILCAPYLTQGLRMLAIRDLDLERLWTFVRRFVLEFALEGAADAERAEGWMPFVCALAEHCFFNEYIFSLSAQESRFLEGLAEKLKAEADMPAVLARLRMAALATAVPLFERADLHKGIARLREGATRDFEALCVLQIDEPLREHEIRPALPVFGSILDRVSREVRAQYEENPYPRWRCANARVSTGENPSFLRSLKILVAGCGTGRQPIDVHYAYPQADILAVDLSRASLAYAVRKTQDAGIKRILYRQGDILELESIGRTFDLIMCSGVLHHMDDPEKGLAVLKKLLGSGGQMNLGLYSARARKWIVAAREYARAQGWTGTPEGIRALRAHIAARPSDDPMRRNLVGAFDFFTMSACRDLLFHVQEHRYTLMDLREMLDRHGLSFLYFSGLDAGALKVFRARYPGAQALCDLEKWDAFEQEHEDAFIGMYQFYVCRKEDKEAILSAPRVVRAVES